MKRLLAVTLTLFVLILLAAPAYSQMSSAKGSSAISSMQLLDPAEKTYSWDPILDTYIKVPQDKELVFDVSLECGLMTDTTVKSKGGAKNTANAEAAVNVRVKLEPVIGVDADGELVVDETAAFYAFPGGLDNPDTEVEEDGWVVTYCQRKQELMAKFGGFDKCVDNNGDGITADECSLTDEELQMILTTLSANSFNFVSANLDQGEYKVTVEAEITSNTAGTDSTAIAAAKGWVGMGSLVVDEVRFIKSKEELPLH